MENSLKPFFSVCIPVWGIKGNGVDYLEYSLNISCAVSIYISFYYKYTNFR